jgi:ATP-dependent helicase/DNAse subunit B
MLDGFINKEREFLKNGNELSIISVEKELQKIVDIQGHKVKLHGYADRIDRVNGDIRVIDYKTGKVDDKDVDIEIDDTSIKSMKSKSIQLLMYKYLYLQENHGISPDKIKPGIVAFLRLSHGIFELNIADAHELRQSFEDTCARYFDELLTEMFNTDIPFSQCADTDPCKICDFKNICKRL